MAQLHPARNPFMLITHPEIVLAAVERSADLGRLTRHQCRPLDKPVLGNRTEPGAADETEAAGEDAGDTTTEA